MRCLTRRPDEFRSRVEESVEVAGGDMLEPESLRPVPIRAWLQFEVEPAADDAIGARLTQTALFDAAGLFGRLYWYALWPIHQLVFGGMLRGIARRVEEG